MLGLQEDEQAFFLGECLAEYLALVFVFLAFQLLPGQLRVDHVFVRDAVLVVGSWFK